MAHSDRLRKQQDALSRWATASNDLLSDCRPIESFSGLATWEPRPGHDISRKAAELDRLTGPAAAALQGTRLYAERKRPGTFQTVPVNPIMAWTTIFDSTPRTSPHVIFACVNRALGLLEHPCR